MATSRPTTTLFSGEPPPRWVGGLVAVLAVAICTALIFPLKRHTPVVSLGVVYLLAVVVVSTVWGTWLGVLTSLLCALAFNYFHLPPTGHLSIRDSRNWVALVTFLVTAVAASSLAEVARARAREAVDRRREADLAAEMARLLLREGPTDEVLPAAAQRLAQALDLPSAALSVEVVEGDERRVAFPLREGTRRLGTLLIPSGASEATLRRVQERIVPALEALMSAGLERETLMEEVVETAALRRADVVKTALLRAVSHDLRSPLTAIRASGEALLTSKVDEASRVELATVVVEESRRLSRVVENLLDLSRLEAGAAEPRREWTALDEVIEVSLSELGAKPGEFSLSLDSELPLVRADAAQLERAFVNVLENARHHTALGEHPDAPVSVRARAVNPSRVIVRIVDRGPGIPPAQLARIFEPFYSASRPRPGLDRGSGLGLAIARGFTEANGGTLNVESLPGQGATFVFELPLDPPNGASR
jgi:two-component system sensor histidine kinase KdpD